MGGFGTADLKSVYARLPKVELHRHLEGSLRFSTLMEVARIYGITLPIRPGLSSLVQMHESDSLTSSNFLSKFQFLRLFYRSPEIIRRITREAVQDAANDQVRYLELRFTPAALTRSQGFGLPDVIDWVAESAQQAGQQWGVLIRLIVSVNCHEGVELAEEVVKLAIERRSKGVVAVDLAGNEAEYSSLPFASLFREARSGGLAITIHAGEWGGAENVRRALMDLQADRIGHGVRVMEDPRVVAMARERGTPFEVCVTSNYQTGVIGALSDHPVRRMLMAGLNVTLNTDDPSVSRITLGHEYKLVSEELGLPRSILYERILAAGRAAFLPPPERKQLVDDLRVELSTVPSGE